MSDSFLAQVDVCDNFNLSRADEHLLPFYLTPDSSPILGLIRPSIIPLLEDHNDQYTSQQPAEPAPWHITSEFISFAHHINTFESRTAVMKELCEHWRDNVDFLKDVIRGRLWRDEPLPVYYSPFTNLRPSNVAFVMERVCCALFGVVTYGVHLTIYTPDMRIWVPRRAKTKQTWPGYLDNTVAGGIPYGFTPWESLIKECMEEASLAEDVVQATKCTGSISYFLRSGKGWLQPEVEYVYDLCLPAPDDPSVTDPARVTPKPLDGEVESFEVHSIREVQKVVK
ncbi:hypothetical protein FRC03_008524 [Tulasnella sp. 419]|nr:hypothetical protein FRC03_008524 [Tulasnella sp. 419]